MSESYSPKFDSFDIHSTPYKTVNGQPIPVHTFIPKAIQPGPHPIIVHFHGGFLITGSAVFAPWTSQWSLDYALQHSALILGVNHRLLPESSGLDILSDITSFWHWLASTFPSYLSTLAPALSADLSRTLCYGESAGGYLAVQSAFLSPPALPAIRIKAVIAAYAMADWDAPEYTRPSTTRSPNGAPQLDPVILQRHIDGVKGGEVVTAALPPERVQLCVVAVQQGRLRELLGDDERLFPLRVLRGLKLERDGDEEGREAPFLFAFHGRDDSAVNYEETVRLVEAWRGAFGEEMALERIEGGDHGFDVGAGLEAEWLKEGLLEVTRRWIGD